MGNPFSHLSATLSARDSLFNQAQWAVESLKRMLFPLQTPCAGTPIKQQHFAMVSYQLRTGHAHQGRPWRNAPLKTALLVIYIMTTHSCWLIVINFPKCLPCGPSGKVRVEKRKKRFSWPCAKCLLFVCLPCLTVARGSLLANNGSLLANLINSINCLCTTTIDRCRLTFILKVLTV